MLVAKYSTWIFLLVRPSHFLHRPPWSLNSICYQHSHRECFYLLVLVITCHTCNCNGEYCSQAGTIDSVVASACVVSSGVLSGVANNEMRDSICVVVCGERGCLNGGCARVLNYACGSILVRHSPSNVGYWDTVDNTSENDWSSNSAWGTRGINDDSWSFCLAYRTNERKGWRDE